MSVEPYYNVLWQDREVRFDSGPKVLGCRPGELIIDSLADVEDVKGNNGQHGTLVVTNLRMIWQLQNKPKINLSIGLATISSISIKTAESKLKGLTQALYILAKFKDVKYQFIFNNLVPNSPRLFTTVQAVHKSYESTPLYRELKMRVGVVKDRQLKLVKQEELYESIDGCWNLSSEQGHLGTLYVTNIRVVWCSNMNELFNISASYQQVHSFRVRESKFGKVLVFETSKESGGLVLGFRIVPVEKLVGICSQLVSLHKIFHTSPIFGVDCEFHESVDHQQLISTFEEDDIVIGHQALSQDILALYSISGSKTDDGSQRDPVFSHDLGLAIEPLKEGFSLDALWNIV